MFFSSYGEGCTEKDSPDEAVPSYLFCPRQWGLQYVPIKDLQKNRDEHEQDEENPKTLLNDVKNGFKDLHRSPHLIFSSHVEEFRDPRNYLGAGMGPAPKNCVVAQNLKHAISRASPLDAPSRLSGIGGEEADPVIVFTSPGSPALRAGSFI
jgi:hypothetical protein